MSRWEASICSATPPVPALAHCGGKVGTSVHPHLHTSSPPPPPSPGFGLSQRDMQVPGPPRWGAYGAPADQRYQQYGGMQAAGVMPQGQMRWRNSGQMPPGAGMRSGGMQHFNPAPGPPPGKVSAAASAPTAAAGVAAAVCPRLGCAACLAALLPCLTSELNCRPSVALACRAGAAACPTARALAAAWWACMTRMAAAGMARPWSSTPSWCRRS